MKKTAMLKCILPWVLFLTACTAQPVDRKIETLEQLNDKSCIIAVETGTIPEEEAKKVLPDASWMFVTSASDGYLAVTSGKADAYAGDLSTFTCAARSGLTGLRQVGESIGEKGDVAVGISPLTEIDGAEEFVNSFLREMKESGILDDMVTRWLSNGDYTIPDIEVPKNPERVIRIGTTGLLEPYTFYEGTELTGFELEFMKRFALWANAEIEISTYDWAGLIPACASGKVDYVMSNLYETAERRESIGFSEPYLTVETILVVRDE